MSSSASEKCPSLQMVDRATEYVIEAQIASVTNQTIRISVETGEVKLSILPRDSMEWIDVHRWTIENGVCLEGMTTEYKNETLYIRFPKTDAEHRHPLSYRKTVDISPIH